MTAYEAMIERLRGVDCPEDALDTELLDADHEAWHLPCDGYSLDFD